MPSRISGAAGGPAAQNICKEFRMKKLVICLLSAALLLALPVTALAAGAGPDPGALEARQAEVHEAAQLLRELGVAEEDPAIRALSEEWWRCQELKGARYMGTYTVTGYDVDCPGCQGKWVNQTASGVTPVPGYTVAMCGAFPFGTKIYIEGLGVYEVQDRGVGPGCVDVACEDHEECYALTGRYKVWVLSEGESV